ncbi:uncharacterized protein LOC120356847 isoform X2 [Solenopsis invicta]|uniref:uncharacterized protein LOC120356847 isoform X2 n=1 Tax=Solenopsis invicta TaxID=13686 RepID=UPI00193DA898|nr:uncharacterized protein LOC120356847 isoform X2 [Solenopsis invicta]
MVLFRLDAKDLYYIICAYIYTLFLVGCEGLISYTLTFIDSSIFCYTERTIFKMRKSFRELSTRQQNRRLQAYESQQEQETNSSPKNTLANVRTNVELASNFYQSIADNSDDSDDNDDRSDNISMSHDRENIINESNGNFSENAYKNEDFSTWLRSWKLKHNISHSAMSELLSQLSICGHADLPKDARTLLRTPRFNSIKISASGDLNIDGLPISKSSKSQIWPILGKIYGNKAFTPFIISVYHGYTKPKSLTDFLAPFCEEYRELQRTGIAFRRKTYAVKIRCVICDSPARSFVTGTKAHNAFFGCGKCMQEGTFDNRRMLFLDFDSPPRTDENFKNRLQEEHHNNTSSLESILPMVSRFPLDYMHLVCLGVTKKLLQLWTNGYHTSKLSGQKITQLSDKLIAISKWIPKEFPRKPRSLDDLSRWKATELRLFLLYVGPIALHGILSQDNLRHFNVLHCAIRILCHSTDFLHNNEYSRDLLIHFVKICKELYGADSIIYNVHNLIHLSEDALKYGSLDNFSAFPYENYMQTIKKMLRKAEKPLQQLYNRISEINTELKITDNESIYPILKKEFREILPANCKRAHRVIQFKDFILTAKKPDNCCYLKDNTIVVIKHICYNGDTAVIIARKFLTKN